LITGRPGRGHYMGESMLRGETRLH
jgi:hypothetical protein